MHILLFDIDGTLLTSAGAGKAAIEGALAGEFGVAMRGHVSYSGRTDRAIGRDLFRLHDLEDSAANWQRLVAGYLRRLPATLATHPGQVLPGVAALLGQLSRRGEVALGLLTGNIREGARLKLAHYGLFGHFAFGGFGDLHFDRDEVAREALAEAQRHLNGKIHPQRIWVIGDTPLDVRCARALGARAVAVATGWHTREELEAAGPDLLLPDLSEASPLLDRLG
ncbi:MAG: haloacid dehalogenase-like hydrolase [Gemmataceae bacterium]|nr:haloacid dehalogenase-like hydrolase [Gemmataceae bacterium]